jgi:UDP-glucose:(heptosyl)LPS alpha-1,3-glucosyltransferase
VVRRASGGSAHGAFGVESPPGGVFWVGSVHRAWMEASRQRSLKGRVRQRCNLFHPVILALERDYFGRRRYRKLIALTGQVKADLQRFYAVPDEDILTLPNGFSATEFTPERALRLRPEMRHKLGYQDHHQVVVFVANELERKGFGPLLRAVARLQDERTHLLAVGRLSPSAYQPEIERLGMRERVQFVGPSADVAPYYGAADVFALPTQYEAWGLVIVEALACGLPVVTSRLAGAAVAVRHGWSGRLLDEPSNPERIAEGLTAFLEGNRAPREDIAASVADYAWSNVLQRYEEVLRGEWA